jgi:hypothetical protein
VWNCCRRAPFSSFEEEMPMKKLAVAIAVLLTSTSLGSAHTLKRHHHGWSNSMNMMRGPGRTAARTDPNGTAAGPTSLSGTGSSKYGGQIPGSSRAARQP